MVGNENFRAKKLRDLELGLVPKKKTSKQKPGWDKYGNYWWFKSLRGMRMRRSQPRHLFVTPDDAV
jgi:hypothetical protein